MQYIRCKAAGSKENKAGSWRLAGVLFDVKRYFLQEVLDIIYRIAAQLTETVQHIRQFGFVVGFGSIQQPPIQ